MQEQQQMIEALTNKVSEQQKQIDMQEKQIELQQKQIDQLLEINKMKR